MQQETNERLLNEMEGADSAKDSSSASSSKASTPTSAGPKKGWFNWSWWNCFLQKSRFFIHIQMYACRCAIEVANPIINYPFYFKIHIFFVDPRSNFFSN